MTHRPAILDKVGAYYAAKLEAHGPNAQGVDWNSEESQTVRFQQLTRLLDGSREGSVLDLGCGYGSLLGHLRAQGWTGRYTGVDVAPAMLAAARAIHGDDGSFTDEIDPATKVDHVVASGIFNVRLDVDVATWEEYVDSTIETMAAVAVRGFAFNMLTSYSDSDRQRADLYYASPSDYFEQCVERYSRSVALLHDYGLYEFTILVRR